MILARPLPCLSAKENAEGTKGRAIMIGRNTTSVRPVGLSWLTTIAGVLSL